MITKTAVPLVLFAVSLLIGCVPTLHFKPDSVSSIDIPATARFDVDLPDAAQLKHRNGGVKAPFYRIGPNDDLIVSVWGRPDLGSQIPSERDNRRNISVVQQDGTISLPFLDDTRVAGMTAKEAAKLIQSSYQRIVDLPLVDVTVVNFRSQRVTMEGAFAKPGNIFLSNTVQTLSDAITVVGGLTDAAGTTRAVLVRGETTYTIDYRSGKEGKSNIQNLLLRPGDRIFFPDIDERLVYVFGEVNKSGAKPIPPSGLTLLKAIAAAGGLNVHTADYRKIYLLREKDGQATIYQLSLDEIMSSAEIPLAAHDRIFVPPTNLAIWDRTWRQLLPFFTSGNNIARTQQLIGE